MGFLLGPQAVQQGYPPRLRAATLEGFTRRLYEKNQTRYSIKLAFTLSVAKTSHRGIGKARAQQNITVFAGEDSVGHAIEVENLRGTSVLARSPVATSLNTHNPFEGKEGCQMIICKECGTENADNTAFCGNCGKTLAVGGGQAPAPPPAQTQQQYAPQQQYPQQQYPQQQYQQYPAYPQYQRRPRSGGLGTGALICGILSLALGWLIWIIGIILGIVAVVLGAVGMGRRERYAVAGLVLGIVGIIMSIIWVIIAILILMSWGVI
jgi:hypothetical protein